MYTAYIQLFIFLSLYVHKIYRYLHLKNLIVYMSSKRSVICVKQIEEHNYILLKLVVINSIIINQSLSFKYSIKAPTAGSYSMLL